MDGGQSVRIVGETDLTIGGILDIGKFKVGLEIPIPPPPDELVQTSDRKLAQALHLQRRGWRNGRKQLPRTSETRPDVAHRDAANVYVKVSDAAETYLGKLLATLKAWIQNRQVPLFTPASIARLVDQEWSTIKDRNDPEARTLALELLQQEHKLRMFESKHRVENTVPDEPQPTSNSTTLILALALGESIFNFLFFQGSGGSILKLLLIPIVLSFVNIGLAIGGGRQAHKLINSSEESSVKLGWVVAGLTVFGGVLIAMITAHFRHMLDTQPLEIMAAAQARGEEMLLSAAKREAFDGLTFADALMRVFSTQIFDLNLPSATLGLISIAFFAFAFSKHFKSDDEVGRLHFARWMAHTQALRRYDEMMAKRVRPEMEDVIRRFRVAFLDLKANLHEAKKPVRNFALEYKRQQKGHAGAVRRIINDVANCIEVYRERNKDGREYRSIFPFLNKKVTTPPEYFAITPRDIIWQIRIEDDPEVAQRGDMFYVRDDSTEIAADIAAYERHIDTVLASLETVLEAITDKADTLETTFNTYKASVIEKIRSGLNAANPLNRKQDEASAE